jgi:hypothetical protein
MGTIVFGIIGLASLALLIISYFFELRNLWCILERIEKLEENISANNKKLKNLLNEKE